MGTLLDRLKDNLHWAVFLLLELLSGLLLFNFNRYQGGVWFTQANVVVAQVLEWETSIFDYIDLKRQNDELTRRNIVLQRNLLAMRQRLAELETDSTYTQRIQARLLANDSIINARVVSNSVRNRDNYLTINRGSNDGVRPEMGVVSGTGLVGIVSRVTPHYALVMSMLNSKSSISCRLRGTNYYGYLKWRGGNPLQAYIDDVPRHAKCRVGDVVETSGYSHVFPQGLFVGKVAQVHDSADGLAYQLEVQLSTDMSNLQSVCVITTAYREELDSLEIRQ